MYVIVPLIKDSSFPGTSSLLHMPEHAVVKRSSLVYKDYACRVGEKGRRNLAMNKSCLQCVSHRPVRINFELATMQAITTLDAGIALFNGGERRGGGYGIWRVLWQEERCV